jgi:hypothetical protein
LAGIVSSPRNDIIQPVAGHFNQNLSPFHKFSKYAIKPFMKIEHIFGSPGKICAILRRFCGNIPFFRAK